MQTSEYGAVSYREQPDFAINGADNFVNEREKPVTPEKRGFVPVTSEESALVSQLNEACKLSTTLQQGLDMCSNINALNRVENRSIEMAASDHHHPVARQLDELKRLYWQVRSTPRSIFISSVLLLPFHPPD